MLKTRVTFVIKSVSAPFQSSKGHTNPDTGEVTRTLSTDDDGNPIMKVWLDRADGGKSESFFIDSLLRSFNRNPYMKATEANMRVIMEGFTIDYFDIKVEAADLVATGSYTYQHTVGGVAQGKPRTFSSKGTRDHDMTFENLAIKNMIIMSNLGMVAQANGTWLTPAQMATAAPTPAAAAGGADTTEPVTRREDEVVVEKELYTPADEE